jgi:hypothetical protein
VITTKAITVSSVFNICQAQRPTAKLEHRHHISEPQPWVQALILLEKIFFDLARQSSEGMAG